jgi:hypothetical protein
MEAMDIRFLAGTVHFAEIIVFWVITRGRVVVFQTLGGKHTASIFRITELRPGSY